MNRHLLQKFQSVIALVVMFLVLSMASSKFLSLDNGLNVLRQISINLCLSIGMTLVILSGGIDLSVGSVLAIAGAVAAGLLKSGIMLPGCGVMLQFTLFGSILAGLLIGLQERESHDG